MNKYIYFLIIIMFLVSFGVAQAFVRPIGGKILVAPISGITCPVSTTTGQFTVRPYNTASPGPYLILLTGQKNQPTPGAMFMGKYFLSPLPGLCYAGNSSVPTFLIVPFQHQSTVK